MKKFGFIALALFLFVSCSNDAPEEQFVPEDVETSNIEEKNVDHEVSNTEEVDENDDLEPKLEEEEKVEKEEKEEIASPPLQDKKNEEKRSETKKDTFAIPAFKKLPEDAAYEAMVLINSGVDVRSQPDNNATVIGKLMFGAHAFAIADINHWTYVFSDGLEGWVNSSKINSIPYDSSAKTVISSPDELLVLVNKQFKLPSNYRPKDLVIPNVAFPFKGTPEKKYMRKVAAQALEELFAASKSEGLELFATSGFRSFSTQQQIFPNNVNRRGFVEANKYSAFPGESEHQTGLAMDVTNREVNFSLTEKFGNTKEGKWVADNAHKYGFIVRYPKGKEHITGYAYEPWHLRYVGKDIAEVIYSSNITFEEYFAR